MHFEIILASLATNLSSSTNGAGSDSVSASLGDASSKSHTDDHNEQYKRMYSLDPIENDPLSSVASSRIIGKRAGTDVDNDYTDDEFEREETHHATFGSKRQYHG